MKKLKKILKWTAIVGGAALAILLITNAILVWTSGARLEKQIAAIRAAGDPVSLQDLARDPIPPQQNAAVFLRRARDDLEAILAELAEVRESESYRQGRPTESEVKAIQSAFEAYPDAIPLLERAADCPDYNPQLDYTLGSVEFLDAYLPHQGDKRQVARFLSTYVLLLLAQQEREGAMGTCLALFRLCGHFDRDPFVVGYLVALACRSVAIDLMNRTLRDGPLSAEARQSLEEELASYDVAKPYEWTLKTERAYGLGCFRTIPGRKLWPYWNYDASAYLHLFDKHLCLASRPYSEFSAACAAVRQDPKARRRVLTYNVLPAMQSCREAMERVRAQIRSLRVLNALQRRAEQGDVSEPKLSDLGLPVEATMDPFTGKSLIVKKRPEGWLIYSVGSNLKDEGGQVDEFRDCGVGPLRPPMD